MLDGLTAAMSRSRLLEDGTIDAENGKAMWVFSLGNGIGPPLFPNGATILKQKMQVGIRFEPDLGESINDIRLSIYADEMERIEETKNLANAERD